MLTACIICHKLNSDHINSAFNDLGGLSSWVAASPSFVQASVALKGFFQLFESYLGEDGDGSGQADQAKRFPLERTIDGGMLSCGDCSKMAESFCDLYQQLKAIELRLNQKILALKNSMLMGQKVPSKMRDFKESGRQLRIPEGCLNDTIEFKRDLVKKCNIRLRKAFPGLKSNPAIDGDLPPAEEHKAPQGSNSVEVDPIAAQMFSHSIWSAPDFGVKPEHVQDPAPAEKPSRNYGKNTVDNERGRPMAHSSSTTHSRPSGLGLELMEEDEDFPRIPVKTEGGHLSPGTGNSEDDDNYNESFVNSLLLIEDSNPSHVDMSPSGSTSTPTSISRPTPSRLRPSQEGAGGSPHGTVNPLTGKYKCHGCSKEYVSHSHLKDHYKNVHLNVRYQCNECDKKFTRRDHYNRHYDSAHLNVTFDCPNCKKSFKRKDRLKEHQRKGDCARRPDIAGVTNHMLNF